MPAVLTTASRLGCAHQGAVLATAGQHALTVDGSPVLLADDLRLAVIVGCAAPTPCVRISAIAAGVSTTLTVGGRPVLLATAQGTTNAGTWRARDAGQTKLEAA
ncbi:hypothetical protein ACOT81_37320 [Streptomyces sp. WI04-05B]|uniref:hypothetical protein n=1 Tax=Streptomyces TaxID=1883 RepID=UPI0029B92079|nr:MULTISPECIES: hypothetical protein [unclassified Streptomyces]MDX2547454.1 hypothetical protein [Streptomyces sp. WI04-05B]MDX2586287.1 hypothetical protein [Streptomyces sp. WI04-05A]MDX3748937.1 hypothetical protein [Streptomyces sp. AK08-02]